MAQTITDKAICKMIGSDWLSEPEIRCDFDYSFGVHISTEHFISRTCEYAPDLDKMFQKWLKKNTNSWGTGLEEFLLDKLPGDTRNLGSGNSYNHESLLSRVIQYTAFELGPNEYRIYPGEYIILEIHRYGDVRGNYSDPRIFQINDSDDGLHFWSMGQCASLYCPDCKDWWYTDDAFHWYASSDTNDIDKMEFHDASDNDTAAWLARWQHQHDGHYSELVKDIEKREPLIALDETHLICPICRSATLQPVL